MAIRSSRLLSRSLFVWTAGAFVIACGSSAPSGNSGAGGTASGPRDGGGGMQTGDATAQQDGSVATGNEDAAAGGDSNGTLDADGMLGEPVLCDGSASLRFAGVNAGGNLSGAPRVAIELGWSLILVDGQCHFWVKSRPDGPVRTGTMSAEQAADFAHSFRLGHWIAPPAMVCPDASVFSLRFADERVSSSCIVSTFTQAYDSWVQILFSAGQNMSGPARYSISDASGDAWLMSGMTSLASAWPLASDPATIMVMPFEETSAEPFAITSDEGNALRAVRDAYLQRPANPGAPWLRIPIMVDGATPRYFNLAMRDVLPFERNGYLGADDFFP